MYLTRDVWCPECLFFGENPGGQLIAVPRYKVKIIKPKGFRLYEGVTSKIKKVYLKFMQPINNRATYFDHYYDNPTWCEGNDIPISIIFNVSPEKAISINKFYIELEV